MKKSVLKSIIRFIEFRLLHVNDSVHRIALGVGLGLFVAWTPFFGIHLLIIFPLAILLGANKFVAFTFVWVNNAFTVIFVYYPSYLLGRGVLGMVRNEQRIAPEQFIQSFKEFGSFGNLLTGFYQTEFWHKVGLLFAKIGTELLVGGLIIGSIVGGLGYLATYYLINSYRRAHLHKRFQQ